MSFLSLAFFIFLPVVIVLYFLLPKKIKPFLLLVASYIFYACAKPYLIFIIVGVTLISYFASYLIDKINKQKTKKFILITSIVLILSVLIFFKYFNFLCQSAIDFLNLFSLNLDNISLNIILPVGISFYTFQALSYVVDVYQGQYKSEKNFMYFALYISFFPQLVAGPIERADELIPQLKESHKFNTDNLIDGLKMLLVGYFCKCCVADIIGSYVDNIYASLPTATSLSVFIASLLFIIQLYCDFFGYSEIARGIAKIMGINLSKNFDHPLFAKNFTEFWSRWHMTLQRWFNDYIYLPLSFKAFNSKHPTFRHIVNLFIVFALCGIWHGANWTFLIWGLFTAFVLSIESLMKEPMNKFVKKHANINNSWWFILLGRLKLALVLLISAILFRSQSIGEVGIAFTRLFTAFDVNYFTDTYSQLGLSLLLIIEGVLLLVGLYIVGRWNDYKIENNTNLIDIKYTANYVMYGLVALLIILCLLNSYFSRTGATFIYFQF